MFDQTIRLAPRVTSYVVVCAECADEHGVYAAQVEGRLALERPPALTHGRATPPRKRYAV